MSRHQLVVSAAILAAVASSFADSPVAAAVDARMLRYPDVSADHIAFVYAGDVWVAPKTGGVANRLSTPAGEETFPRFSPDGSRIAFGGNYDGNTDIYVMPTTGGLPFRVTHHPDADRMLDWYPDGDTLLYASGMTSTSNRFNQLWRTSAEGGLPERLPVPYGEFGSISPDGRWLAYTPKTRDFRTWKRYRGGLAPDIWLFDLKTGEARNLTDNVANDAQPMWHGSTLYFLSDRDANERYNIWAVEPGTGAAPREVTHFEEMDIAFPAIGPDAIVFSVGADLWRLDLDDESLHKVEIEVVTDQATLRPRLESVADNVFSGGVSPSGKRLVIGARGEVFTVPVEHGVTLNLTRSSGVAERSPSWSPDGKTIAYWSDRTGEYELTLRNADGSGQEEKVTSLGPGFRFSIFWSPDSRKLVWVDQAMNVNLLDRDSHKVTKIDKGLYLFYGALRAFTANWSADSRWVAWNRSDPESRNSAVFVYDTRKGEKHQVTSGFYTDVLPTFDPEGKYLYLITSRTFRPSYSDLDDGWIYANTHTIAALPLRADVASPLAPRNDVEGKDEDKDKKGDKDNEKKGKGADGKTNGKNGGDDDKAEEKKEKPTPVEIDFDGLERRLVMLPPKAGNYTALAALKGKVLYQRRPRTGSGDEARPVVYWDLEEREEKTILADADAYGLADGGEKLVAIKDHKWYVVDVKPDQKLDKPVDLSGMTMELDPPAEWRQIFNDVWRIERDFFYDPGMHGVDWPAMRERYGALLDDVITRWDVNFLIGELIAELNTSHSYRGGGDTQTGEQQGVGLLGADFALEQGAYRIVHIVDGGSWDSEVRSPLRTPGVNVKVGDWLLAVNGRPIDPKLDPWAAFEGLAGKTVELTVNDKPTTDGARHVLVETLGDEGRLRNLEWIEANRKRVDEATGGRVGYIYVPDTSRGGQDQLVRMFQAQYAKDGLIVDERFNSGGQIPDRFVELLGRKVTNYWAVRDGRDWQWPPVANDGPKVMLINGWSGSGGDCFPFYFREAGLGPLVGTRTWGGLIGISGTPPLIDGGGVTAPSFAIYSTDGQWIIEGRGVEPDIEVVDDPAAMAKGRDPQLEAAITQVKKMLETSPPAKPKRPAYPDRSGARGRHGSAS